MNSKFRDVRYGVRNSEKRIDYEREKNQIGLLSLNRKTLI